MAPGSVQLADGRVIVVVNNISSGYAVDATKDYITGKIFVSASRLGVPYSFSKSFSSDVYRKINNTSMTCADLLAATFWEKNNSGMCQWWYLASGPPSNYYVFWAGRNESVSFVVPSGKTVKKIWIAFNKPYAKVWYGTNTKTLTATGAINNSMTMDSTITNNVRYMETTCNFSGGETITVNLSLDGNDVCQLANAEVYDSRNTVWGIVAYVGTPIMIVGKN